MSDIALTLEQDQERQEHLEYRQVLLDIQAVLETKQGQRFISYLFKHLEVGELPAINLDPELLRDRLGSLRPGALVFDLISAADHRMAGIILAEIKKKKMEREIYVDQMVQDSLRQSK